MAVTVWLARWSRLDKKEQERPYYVYVLALLAFAAVVLSLFRAVLAFYSLVKVHTVQHIEVSTYEIIKYWQVNTSHGSFIASRNKIPFSFCCILVSGVFSYC